MYLLVYSATAFKHLKKLDKETQIRIISTLERIRVRPYPHVKKLIQSPYFRLRIGRYSVILDIKENELIILVLEVGHRKNIYSQ